METHQRNRYATEAVAALVKWAFTQGNVLRIIAETLLDGILSQRVLLKDSFQYIGDSSEPGIIRYELKKEDFLKHFLTSNTAGSK